MKIELLLCLVIVFGHSMSSNGQDSQATSPNGQDTQASLETSMKSIRDSLNEHHQNSLVVYLHDNKNGRDIVWHTNQQYSNIVVDASSCSISFNVTLKINVANPINNSYSASFKDVDEVRVRTLKDLEESLDSTVSYRPDPPAYSVLLYRNGSTKELLGFYLIDSKAANDLGQSMADAAKLCQGGREVQLSLATVSNSTSEEAKSSQPSSLTNSTTKEGGGSESASSLPIHYQACGWFWQQKGESGHRTHHFSAGPVIQIRSDLNSPPNKCGWTFGRWVVKNHPEIIPENDPDSPNFIPQDGLLRCLPKDECNSDDTYMGQQKVRQQNIEQQRSYGVEVEELGWTPPLPD